MITVDIVEEPLDPTAFRSAMSDSAGGVSIFIGTTRAESEGRKVRYLEYEAYRPMALQLMRDLAEDIRHRWPVGGITMIHRTGRVEVGEPSVLIAVSAPHRPEAFEACRYAIDTLKRTVPIWKKEVFMEGAQWGGAPKKIEPDAFTRRAFP